MRDEFECEGECEFEGEYEGEYEYEYEGEFEGEYEYEYEFETLHGELELQLAAELLEISSEHELNHFLGGLLKKGASLAKGFISSPTGKALLSGAKGLAKKALPTLGSAVGGYFGGSTGADIGRRLATWGAGQLEMGNEFETARRVVRATCAAGQAAARSPRRAPPMATARKALVRGVRRAASGTRATINYPRGRRQIDIFDDEPLRRNRAAGRWIRRGRRIVLLDV